MPMDDPDKPAAVTPIFMSNEEFLERTKKYKPSRVHKLAVI